MTLISEEPAPGTGPERGTPSARSTRNGLSWIDLLLLVVVLGALVTLLACDVELAHAVTIVGVGGLLTAELRRRLS